MKKRKIILGKYIEGPPLRGSQKDLDLYSKSLARLLNDIRKDIQKEVLPLYQKDLQKRANDSFFDNILMKIEILIKKYSDPKTVVKETISFGYVNSDYVYHTKRNFSNRNDIAINWKSTGKTKTILKDAISENVDLIKTIPRKYLEDVKKEFYKASEKGWNAQKNQSALVKRHGVARRRAFNIAVDQRNKVINAVNKQSNKDAGIDFCIWRIRSGVKDHRDSHLRADGEIYENDKGCLIDGKRTFPGKEINCHCYSVPAIPLAFRRKKITTGVAA